MLDLTTVVPLAFTSVLAVGGVLVITLFGKATRKERPRVEKKEGNETQKLHLELNGIAEWLPDALVFASQDAMEPRERLRRVIGMAPRAAMIKAFRELEDVAASCLETNVYPGYSCHRLATGQVLEHLKHHRVLEDNHLDLYRSLDRLRGQAFGMTNSAIRPEAAAVFVQAVGLLESELRKFQPLDTVPLVTA